MVKNKIKLKKITAEDVQKMYDRLYDRQERRITTSLTKWYDNHIIETRRQLIAVKDNIAELTEDNADVTEQMIIRLLDTNQSEKLFIEESKGKFNEADKTLIKFLAEDFKRDNALRPDQINSRGIPIINLIGGTAVVNFESRLKVIAKRSTETINKNMTNTVIRNKLKGMNEDQAINETVKSFSKAETKKWRLKRIVRSNLTTFYGTRTENMIIQNDLYTGKMWLTRNDEKVRDSHHENQRQGTISKNQTFQNGQRFPGDREGVNITQWINCRCYMRGVK